MHVFPVLAIIQGWDQLVSACLGILAAGVAALGPKLLARAGEWLDGLKPNPQPVVAGGPTTMPDMTTYQPPTVQGDTTMSTTEQPGPTEQPYPEAQPLQPEPEQEPPPPEEEEGEEPQP